LLTSTQGTSERGADGYARSRACYRAATRQHRFGLALGFLGLQQSLRRATRVLRRIAVVWVFLHGKICVVS